MLFRSKAIEGAKMVWSLNAKKGDADVPSDNDLFGATKEIKDKPNCPGNGTYTLGAVQDRPTCSIPDHSLDMAAQGK